MIETSRVLAVIPARMQSQRLPGKPLADISGKTLIQRVWERASLAKSLAKTVVATDDIRIFDFCKKIGAPCLMTGSDNITGSDRVAEAYSILAAKGEHFDLVANVQGDMPFINPLVIDKAVRTLADSSSDFGMSTIATPIFDQQEFLKPSAVKAVPGEDGSVLYFTRAPAPFIRDMDEFRCNAENPFGYKHMGLYVFRPAALTRLKMLPQALSEKREKLEQLRALAHGIRIRLVVVSRDEVSPSIEVDTPEDLAAAAKAAADLDSMG